MSDGNDICLAGSGWGAISALRGLRGKFDNIKIVTEDDEVKRIANSFGVTVCTTIHEVTAALFVCAGFTDILSREFLSSRSVLNIHYSLLPKYRGLHSTVWAILNGEEFLGLTVHAMTSGVDDGPIIYQHRLKNNGQSAREIMESLNQHVEDNLGPIVCDYLAGDISPFDQDECQATWVCKRNLDDCMIDFSWEVEYLSRFFQALVDPYPRPRILVRGEVFEIVEFDIKHRPYHMQNGRVVNKDSCGVWVKVTDGFLVIKNMRRVRDGAVIDPHNFFALGMRLQ